LAAKNQIAATIDNHTITMHINLPAKIVRLLLSSRESLLTQTLLVVSPPSYQYNCV